RDLGKKLFQELIGLLACWVECRQHNPGLTFDRVGPWGASEFRMTHEPAGDVSRHIALGHHANPAISSIGDDLANLLLSVEQTIASHLVKLWKSFGLDSKSLIFGEVPMQYVEFYRSHSIEVPFEHLDGFVVTTYVDEQPAPRKARLVLNARRRKKVSRSIAF